MPKAKTTQTWLLDSVALRDAYTDFILSRQAMNRANTRNIATGVVKDNAPYASKKNPRPIRWGEVDTVASTSSLPCQRFLMKTYLVLYAFVWSFQLGNFPTCISEPF
jgi:hypothetical protein